MISISECGFFRKRFVEKEFDLSAYLLRKQNLIPVPNIKLCKVELSILHSLWFTWDEV